jgi:hypothetical protein
MLAPAPGRAGHGVKTAVDSSQDKSLENKKAAANSSGMRAGIVNAASARQPL